MAVATKLAEHRAKVVDSTISHVKRVLRQYHATGVLEHGELVALVDELSMLLVRLERVRSFGGDFASLDVSSQLAWLCHHVANGQAARVC